MLQDKKEVYFLCCFMNCTWNPLWIRPLYLFKITKSPFTWSKFSSLVKILDLWSDPQSAFYVYTHTYIPLSFFSLVAIAKHSFTAQSVVQLRMSNCCTSIRKDKTVNSGLTAAKTCFSCTRLLKKNDEKC